MSIFIPVLFLAIVQAIAEFLPISSSGHLLVIQNLHLFDASLKDYGEETCIFINVALHMATLVAIIVYLRKDVKEILSCFFRDIADKNFSSPNMLLIRNLIIATVPASIAGILIRGFLADLYAALSPVFIFFIINGFVLITTKKIPVKTRKIEETGIIGSVVIGLFQAAAILPGISRSGMTITGGLFMGLSPNESARFSFLMAIPVIAGAGLLEAKELFSENVPSELLMPLGAAMLIAVFIALASMKLLFGLVRRLKIDLFGYYTAALGVAGIILTALQ